MAIPQEIKPISPSRKVFWIKSFFSFPNGIFTSQRKYAKLKDRELVIFDRTFCFYNQTHENAFQYNILIYFFNFLVGGVQHFSPRSKIQLTGIYYPI